MTEEVERRQEVRVHYPFPVPPLNNKDDLCVLAEVPARVSIAQLERLQCAYDGVLEIFQCPTNREVVLIRLPLKKEIDVQDVLLEAMELERFLSAAFDFQFSAVKMPNNWLQIEQLGHGTKIII